MAKTTNREITTLKTSTRPKITLSMKLAILVALALMPAPSFENSHCSCVDSTGSDIDGDDLGHDGESNGDGLVVYLAALVPNTTSHPFSLARARPAVDVAVLQLQKRGIFKRDTIKVIYKDSACSTTTGPLAAFNLWSARRVHVFLGPVCDFPVAAVARFSRVWNVPVLSPGAFAHDFGISRHREDSEFQTLTRMSANFNSLSIAITTMVDAHYWEKVIILYDVMGFPEIMGNFCYLAVSAVVYYGKKLQNRPFEFHIFNPEKYDPENMLKDKVGLKFGVLRSSRR